MDNDDFMGNGGNLPPISGAPAPYDEELWESILAAEPPQPPLDWFQKSEVEELREALRIVTRQYSETSKELTSAKARIAWLDVEVSRLQRELPKDEEPTEEL